MDQTLNAKMMDENNEMNKHDTEFHEFRTAVAAGADLQHSRMVKEVTQSSPQPSGKASSATRTSLTRPVRTTQFSHNDAVGVPQEGKNMTNSQLETGTSR